MAITGTKVKNTVLDELQNGSNNNRGNNKPDPYLLEYFNLGDGGNIEVLFIPDENGVLNKEFAKHGSNIRNIRNIGCIYEATGDNCPICFHYFENFQKGDETNDQELKDYALKFKKKFYYLWQVVVINSDIDIEYPEEDNLVKLVYLPKSIHEIIKQSLRDGDVQDPTEVVFRIKKTMNNRQAQYHTSRFVKEFTEENYGETYRTIVEAVENNMIRPYNFDSVSYVPSTPSQEDAKEWLNQAIQIVNGDNDTQNNQGRNSQPQQSVPNESSESSAPLEQEDTGGRTDYDEEFSSETSGSDNSVSGGNSAPSTKAQEIQQKLKQTKNS